MGVKLEIQPQAKWWNNFLAEVDIRYGLVGDRLQILDPHSWDHWRFERDKLLDEYSGHISRTDLEFNNEKAVTIFLLKWS